MPDTTHHIKSDGGGSNGKGGGSSNSSSPCWHLAATAIAGGRWDWTAKAHAVPGCSSVPPWRPPRAACQRNSVCDSAVTSRQSALAPCWHPLPPLLLQCNKAVQQSSTLTNHRSERNGTARRLPLGAAARGAPGQHPLALRTQWWLPSRALHGPGGSTSSVVKQHPDQPPLRARRQSPPTAPPAAAKGARQVSTLQPSAHSGGCPAERCMGQGAAPAV